VFVLISLARSELLLGSYLSLRTDLMMQFTDRDNLAVPNRIVPSHTTTVFKSHRTYLHTPTHMQNDLARPFLIEQKCRREEMGFIMMSTELYPLP
jgi:hypothetical protein